MSAPSFRAAPVSTVASRLRELVECVLSLTDAWRWH